MKSGHHGLLGGPRYEQPAKGEPGNVADLLHGTPRLNVPITRTVFGVSGHCRVAVIGLKPIDRALTITRLMTVAMSANGAALACYSRFCAGRGTNKGVL
jgi:hypothetical protein